MVFGPKYMAQKNHMQYRTDEQEDKSDISTKTYYLVELNLYKTESHLNKYLKNIN